ncbi:MAG: PspC domain-containing protein [Clostridiales bacterium]|nr:PspC domain-containing protein [Clostridiales bacterium]
MDKKLYRSRTDKKISGVCGGIAEYFNIDSTIIRLVVVFLTLAWFTGLIIYIVAALIIPEEPAPEDLEQIKKGAVDADVIKEEEKDNEDKA